MPPEPSGLNRRMSRVLSQHLTARVQSIAENSISHEMIKRNVSAVDQKKRFSCGKLPVPSCHATRRKHEGWDTARLPKPRQGKSRGRGQ
ncbi:hypothetical protein T265_03662 [Opisthorchis viverrini]|uniref:Uncharacterized protein n=1 Tax=Opisthorchis viverrini TaxID=6198 RepID=A0A075A2J0_OPIVI|nr:hypothetical protein T265_03662 [Opisthorchis viverrini]KER29750.1 hypothetical protein T265_03662 [Opisthorchis viverrini]